MSKIRVLIVDDSVVIRQMVANILAEDPELEIAGTAANGKIALAKIPQVNPDLITLDIEMPELNGLETLAEIRKIYRKLPVIMFSTLTERGGKSTLDALSLGASDYVTKPTQTGSMSASMQSIREKLIPKIKGLCSNSSPEKSSLCHITQIQMCSPAEKTRKIDPHLVEMVAIGVSTGGPNALAEVVPRIPADFPAPVLIVQHMPPMFTRLLADRLASQSRIKVAEAKDGLPLRAGSCWLAPGNFHMSVQRKGATCIIKTDQNPPENSCRPAVDVLFRSVANVFGANVLAVILTGMGYDGLRGCERIHDVGGKILAQDKNSSVVWGMPGSVVNAGLADKILPLRQISEEIIRKTSRKSSMAPASVVQKG